MSQTSGTECVSHERDLVHHISEYFNNPDMSDLTLTVGEEQSYHVHRFVLASQSTVFRTMLTHNQWKESTDKVVTLEESPECQAAFEGFLKFFYTGKLTLTCENVCAIHMLADKYDVPLLKRDGEKFMLDVLEGLHDGMVLTSAVKWLTYIEQFVQNLTDTCYRAISNNFTGLDTGTNKTDIDVLSTMQLSTILKNANASLSFPVISEHFVFSCVSAWAKLRFSDLTEASAMAELRTILPLIQYHNMNYKELQQVEQSPVFLALGEAFANECLSPAYKVHAQMLNITQRKEYDDLWYRHGSCECSKSCCIHTTPRMYMMPPFGLRGALNLSKSIVCQVPTIDLGSIGAFVKVFCQTASTERTKWEIKVEGKYSLQQAGGKIHEAFHIRPDVRDLGRRFTIAISVVGPITTANGTGGMHYRYTLVESKTLPRTLCTTTLRSKMRAPGSWKMDTPLDRFLICIAIHLHE